MAVDTSNLRWQAQAYNDPSLSKAADEIDSLRAQIAEAKADAIPWRDGPAVGGEMPAHGVNVVAVIVKPSWPKPFLIHAISLGSKLATAGDIDDEYWPGEVIRWCYESDLLPSVAAKPVEANP